MENTSLKKVAIIGYGGMGSWHAKYILGGGALELAGIYDIDPARIEAAKETPCQWLIYEQDHSADRFADAVESLKFLRKFNI